MTSMFTPDSGKGDKPSLIPHGTLHFASANVQGISRSREGEGGQYAKLELILIDGPYEGRRVYTIIMDPSDPKNVDQAKRNAVPPKSDAAKMGLTALTRAFEACRIFDTANPESYKRLDGRDFAGIVQALQGQRVAVKIKVKPGKDGYDDKNEVAEWLSPNPGSGGAVGWIQPPRATAPAPAPAPAQGFTQPQPNPAPGAPNRPAWVD